jgi:hypothetical protein
MKFIREHIGFKLLWLVMALHILNCSVDTPDPQPENIPEDLSYNDMESIVEIVLEEGLNIKDAIPEADDNDDAGTSDFTLKVNIDWFMPHQTFTISYFTPVLQVEHNFEYHEQYTEQFHPEITPPPPKA